MVLITAFQFIFKITKSSRAGTFSQIFPKEKHRSRIAGANELEEAGAAGDPEQEAEGKAPEMTKTRRRQTCNFQGCTVRIDAPNGHCVAHRCGVPACALRVVEEGADFCWEHQLPGVYVWQCESHLACDRHAHLRLAVEGCPLCRDPPTESSRCNGLGRWRVLRERNKRTMPVVALVCDRCAPHVVEI